MTEFPLYKLPSLCLDCVLGCSEFQVLICYTLISERCQRIAISLKNRLTGFDINVDKNRTLLTVKANDEIFGKLSFKRYEGPLMDISPSSAKFTYEYCIEDPSQLCIYTRGHYPSAVASGISLLGRLFKKPIAEIHFQLDDTPKENLIFGPRDCKNLIISGEQRARRANLLAILENVNASKCVSIRVPIYSDFTYDLTSIHAESITVTSGHWITRPMILSVDRIGWSIQRATLTSADCVDFIRKWMSSSDTMLKYFQVICKKGTVFELNFDGIKNQKWDSEQRSQFYSFASTLAIDCERGIDFLRSDGSLSTLLIIHHCFLFLVWKERFHDTTGLPILSP